MYPSRPEPYIKLWYYYYSMKSYNFALSVAEAAFLKLAEISGEYEVITNLNYAKSLFKMEKFRSCFELLQMMYTQNSQFLVYLYHYGRLCLKSKDPLFLGTAVGALEECLKICSHYRYGIIYYWLMTGYLAGNDKVQGYYYAKSGIPVLTSIIERLSQSSHNRNHEKKVSFKLNEMKNLVKEMHMEMLNIEILDKILNKLDEKKAEEA